MAHSVAGAGVKWQGSAKAQMSIMKRNETGYSWEAAERLPEAARGPGRDRQAPAEACRWSPASGAGRPRVNGIREGPRGERCRMSGREDTVTVRGGKEGYPKSQKSPPPGVADRVSREGHQQVGPTYSQKVRTGSAATPDRQGGDGSRARSRRKAVRDGRAQRGRVGGAGRERSQRGRRHTQAVPAPTSPGRPSKS